MLYGLKTQSSEDGAVLTLEFEDTLLTVNEILDGRKLPDCGNILLALVEDLYISEGTK